MKRPVNTPAKAGKPSGKSRVVKARSPQTRASAGEDGADASGKARPAAKAKGATKGAVSPALPVKAHRSLCPINLVLEVIGDNWSLLILRDLMFRGHSSYQAFLRSDEKIATNILADRLLRLEQNGLITKSADPRDARKFVYAVTAKGADLAPLLVEMTLYSHRHAQIIDMPKEVVADMLRNKQAFTTRMIRNHAPKPRARGAKPEAREGDETLSLF